MPGLQPQSLTKEELVRYAHLENNNGLPKEWCDALIAQLDDALEEIKFLQNELAVQEQLVADLEDELNK